MRFRLWLPWLLLAFACGSTGTLDVRPTTTEPTPSTSTSAAPTTIGEFTAPTATTPLAPPAGVDVLVAAGADGFRDVADALAAATQQWESAGPGTYAYRLRIDCQCADRGTRWVRVFDPDGPHEEPWDVDALHGRIRAALARSPDRIEVAFHPELGIPVWFAVDGGDSETILVEDFHEIAFTATPYDGLWRFIGGELDGREFGNPTTGLIIVTLGDGFLSFPIDCNQAGGPVDIHGSSFGVGGMGSTAVGCGEYSEEGELFAQAVQAATTVEKVGPNLVLSGENGELRMVALEQPERRGKLPLTAAGETLVLAADSGGLAPAFTISPTGDGWPHGHPGRSIWYTLNAVDAGSDEDPTWSEWEGEFEVSEPTSGPQKIVMPDDIGVRDYQLCSPYWSDNFFCYELPVRPASAPWYVTAGSGGVVLHDADGTSRTVWEGAARVAFWFDDLLMVEPQAGRILAVQASGATRQLSDADARLLDAARMGDTVKALITRGGQAFLLDVDTGEETLLGPAAIQGRVGGDSVILRTSPERIAARSSGDGSLLWELEVEPQEMLSSATTTEVRLDTGQLSTDSSLVPFWQYLNTRIVDISTGGVVDEFRFELAIPLEGSEVTEPCLRAELRDGLMLCPQPDGRFTTIGVEGGDQQTIAGLADVIATYVR